ncbi:MAG TPA: hypothetical protein VJX70_07475 [Candidatus Acidoferrum sp.]|nr:hypothetical protein [Candidatus Acidoferrum sp.]
MPPYFRFAILLILTVMLGLPLGSSSSPGQGHLLATVEVISQKYCSVEDDELFAVDLKLRVNFQNHSDKVLILDKQFGKFASEQIIAKSKESLALGNLESNPIFDSFGYEDPPHFKPSTKLLRSNFILLAPGQSFESSTTVGTYVWYVSKPDKLSVLNYGSHVLQMGFVGWSYAAKAAQFAEAWQKFGELVTEVIYTEPIEFQIPRNPTIEKTCN